jgi:hypothetical protein
MKNQLSRMGGGLAGFMVVFVGVLIAAPGARAEQSALSNPKVTFTATGSNGVKIVGAGTQLKLEVRGSLLIFKVPLHAMTTRVDARDRQMRDRYLEADTHPSVELRLAREALTIPKSDGATEGNANAKLILHGKARDTIVHYSLERKGDSLKVTGTFRVDLRVHGIDIPNYRGVTMRPDVDVEVAFGTMDRAVVADAR